MCGILGIKHYGNGKLPNLQIFNEALETMKHRGPDGRSIATISENIMLGHVRLSIIDISAASTQPMHYNNDYWLTFNGEIYNYLEIKQTLQDEGVEFFSDGDAEVLLQSYVKWGPDCVEKLNGMWSFAIYDRRRDILFCSRDRFGEKPFYFSQCNGNFIFSSEIKAILKLEPNLAEPYLRPIANFCRSSVGAQHARTWFKNIFRLQPGHNLILQGDKVNISRYWSYPSGKTKSHSFEDAIDKYRALFEDSVRLRMRSDVPIGVTLSSGLDSSSIACVMQKNDPSVYYSFTARPIGEQPLMREQHIYTESDGIIDETIGALQLAESLGFRPKVIDIDYQNFLDDLSEIIWHLESGNSSPAVVPCFHIFRAAKSHVSVVLEGQGADELLGGYLANGILFHICDLAREGKFVEAFLNLIEFQRTYKISFGIIMFVRLMSNKLPFLAKLYQIKSGLGRLYGPLLRDQRFERDYPEYTPKNKNDRLTNSLQEQHSGGLVNLLHYGDAVSMASGIETRQPFLDHRLVEFVWQLPGSFKIRLGKSKALHREAMRNLVPGRIIDDPVKFGFSCPVSEQFRKLGGPKNPVDVLLSEKSLSRGLFVRKELEKVIRDHQTGKRDHGTLLFRLLCTELWFRIFIDPYRPAAVT